MCPQGADADAMAQFYTTVLNGLALQARDGAGGAALDRVIDGAMAAWDVLAKPRSHTSAVISFFRHQPK